MNHTVYVVRILTSYVGMCTVAFFLTRHLYSIQITKHPELYAKAASKYTARKTWSGTRGSIFDRRGNLLAGNIECKNILADLHLLPRDPKIREEIIAYLSETLSVDRDILAFRMRSHAREVVVRNYVDIDVAAIVAARRIAGLRFVDDQRRYYPKDALLANVLGFTTSRNRGVYGLEAIWDKDLASKDLEQIIERDRRGRSLGKVDPVKTRAISGKSLYLTIEEPIQHYVEVELRAMCEEFKPKRAYAIMADPRTGAVMAMAQYPTFNPNDRRAIEPEMWRVHGISDVYDPGSTMKCVAIAGALDYGVVSPDTVFDCEDGMWMYGRRSLRDSGHKFGLLTVSEIVQKSSNIGTAKVALQLGKPRLFQVFRRFGFGETTGIGLRHESPGIFRKVRDWDGLSITRFPIGQGISVTPVQMVQAYGALANRGKMMKLRLVERLVDPVTGDAITFPPELKRVAVRPPAAQAIVEAMCRVTAEGGTALKAAVEGYQVAGKTGTAQKLINGSYTGHGKYVASFIGFVPAHDPAFVLLVVADEPSNGRYYGGTVAAPTFSRIADQVLHYLSVPPTVASGGEADVIVRR